MQVASIRCRSIKQKRYLKFKHSQNIINTSANDIWISYKQPMNMFTQLVLAQRVLSLVAKCSRGLPFLEQVLFELFLSCELIELLNCLKQVNMFI